MNVSTDIRPSFGGFEFVLKTPTLMHAAAVALGGSIVYYSFNRKRIAGNNDSLLPATEKKKPAILEPLHNFNYQTTPPITIRPYKPIYHLNMGIQSLSPNELIMLDRNYRMRLAKRRHLMRTHHNTTGCLPHASWAVNEFYTYLISNHLPTRFPTVFSKSPSGTLVLNQTTSDTYPVIPQSSQNALTALGENLDEDFVFLVPDAEGVYRVGAFVMCFPNGFDMSTKLGATMEEIHKPVPELQAKLGKSIERHFARMTPGVENGVKRTNWSISRSSELWTPQGTHVYDGEEIPEDVAINPEECCLRVERQTIWKLPGTGAIVFGIKTYLTPLSEIKQEAGEAEKLATAIEGLGDKMGRYKARGVWGSQVLQYLRA
ncbi:hypothetical protein BZA77DRAFT_343188 [Pyronema omphalodes]|nr:hypothetical protein BZA77DRAFT_343188 [Pyronema omphalodes]